MGNFHKVLQLSDGQVVPPRTAGRWVVGDQRELRMQPPQPSPRSASPHWPLTCSPICGAQAEGRGPPPAQPCPPTADRWEEQRCDPTWVIQGPQGKAPWLGWTHKGMGVHEAGGTTQQPRPQRLPKAPLATIKERAWGPGGERGPRCMLRYSCGSALLTSWCPGCSQGLLDVEGSGSRHPKCSCLRHRHPVSFSGAIWNSLNLSWPQFPHQ